MEKFLKLFLFSSIISISLIGCVDNVTKDTLEIKASSDLKNQNNKDTLEEVTDSKSDNEEKSEEYLTIDNCSDLQAILATKNEFDPIIEDFSGKYYGQTIEFNGYIANVAPHESYNTRFDYLIYVGDFNSGTFSGPYFQFSDVNYNDLHLTGDNIPDTLGEGINIHIVAKVGAYNKMSGLFQLDPIEINIR